MHVYTVYLNHVYPSNPHEPLWKSGPRTLQRCLGSKAMEQRLNLPKRSKRHYAQDDGLTPCDNSTAPQGLQGNKDLLHMQGDARVHTEQHLVTTGVSRDFSGTFSHSLNMLVQCRPAFETWLHAFSKVCRPGPSSWRSC